MPSRFQQRGVQRFSGLPWEKKPNITDVIWSGWPYIDPKIDGAVITTLTPARGMSGAIQAALYTTNNYGGKGAYAIEALLGGNSSYFKCDALASYISGTGKAWSSFFAGSIPRTTNAGLWLLWSFTRSTSNFPIVYAQGSGTVSQDFQIFTRNDANVLGPSSSVFSPGRNRFALTTICTGATMTTRFNMQTVDNAIPWVPGPTTLDLFAVGLSLSTGGFSSPDFTVYAAAPTAWGPDDYEPLESWAMRYMRI